MSRPEPNDRFKALQTPLIFSPVLAFLAFVTYLVATLFSTDR
jgi:hypothetical protein